MTKIKSSNKFLETTEQETIVQNEFDVELYNPIKD